MSNNQAPKKARIGTVAAKHYRYTSNVVNVWCANVEAEQLKGNPQGTLQLTGAQDIV